MATPSFHTLKFSFVCLACILFQAIPSGWTSESFDLRSGTYLPQKSYDADVVDSVSDGQQTTGFQNDFLASGVLLSAETTSNDVQQDTEVPELSITGPVAGDMLYANGFEFKGTVSDRGQGVSEVRIFVYDVGRGMYTVSNELASYDAGSGTWGFQVLSSYITAGQKAVLYARAEDKARNKTQWKVMSVNISTGTDPGITSPVTTILLPALGSEPSASGFMFSGMVTDNDSKVSEVRVNVYDYGRGTKTVTDALAAYNEALGTWSFDVLSSHVTAGKDVKLSVRAKDEGGNWSDWQDRIVRIQQAGVADTEAPELNVTSPVSGSQPYASGFEFKGTVSDRGQGVSEVRIFVYDLGRGMYTVSNGLAAYDAGSGTWGFQVLSSHITAGRQAVLYARAEDKAGNKTEWKVVSVNISTGTDPGITSPVTTISLPALGSEPSASGFMFSGMVTDNDSKVSEVRVNIYDYGRGTNTVTDALAVYYEASGTWSFNVLASHVTTGKDVKLSVRAKDEGGNWSDWQDRTVRIQQAGVADTEAPELNVTSPVSGSQLYVSGFEFKGTVSDRGQGVSEVRIFVYDVGRGMYTVSNELASYDAGTGTWTFQILSSHITAGRQAVLYACAEDKAGNKTEWKVVSVNVAAGTLPIPTEPLVITAVNSTSIEAVSGHYYPGSDGMPVYYTSYYYRAGLYMKKQGPSYDLQTCRGFMEIDLLSLYQAGFDLSKITKVEFIFNGVSTATGSYHFSVYDMQRQEDGLFATTSSGAAKHYTVLSSLLQSFQSQSFTNNVPKTFTLDVTQSVLADIQAGKLWTGFFVAPDGAMPKINLSNPRLKIYF